MAAPESGPPRVGIIKMLYCYDRLLIVIFVL